MRSRQDYSRSREKDYHQKDYHQQHLSDRHDKGQLKEEDRNSANVPNTVEIYNIPDHHNKDDIAYYIFEKLASVNGLMKKSLSPIIRSEYDQEKNCIVLEFRSRQQALNCLQLNGLYYVHLNTNIQKGNRAFFMKSKLMARERPKLDVKNLKIRVVLNKVQEGFNKIFIGNLPEMLEYQLIDKLSAIGELKALENITTNKAQVQYYCQFKNKDKTDEYLAKLNELKIKSRVVIAKRAALITPQTTKTTKVRARRSMFQFDQNTFYLTLDIDGYFKSMKISCILLLKNVISNFMVKDEILKDIRKELSKVGPIVKIVDYEKNLYVEFERVQYAQIAYLVLSHRKFQGKALDISFYDPIHFADELLI